MDNRNLKTIHKLDFFYTMGCFNVSIPREKMFQYQRKECFNTRGWVGSTSNKRKLRGHSGFTVGTPDKTTMMNQYLCGKFQNYLASPSSFLAKNAIIVKVYLDVNIMGLKFSRDSPSQCHKFRMLMWLLVIVKTEEHLALSSDCDLWRRTPGLTRRLLKQNCCHDLQNHKIFAIVCSLSAVFLIIGCDKNNDHPHLVWLIPDIVL